MGDRRAGVCAAWPMSPPASRSSPESAGSTSASHGLGFDISRSVRSTLTADGCSVLAFPASRSEETCEPSTHPYWDEVPRVFSAEASPAKTSLEEGDEPDSRASAPVSSSSSAAAWSLFDPDGFSSRTYPNSSPRTAVGTSESYLEHWPTSGTAWRGGFSTHASSECRSVDGECSSSEPSLTEILEPPQSVPPRFWLSARAAEDILRRCEERGEELSLPLYAALLKVMRT